MLTKEQILKSRAEFDWSFARDFLVTLDSGEKFVWSDPDYNGDNSFVPFFGTLKDFCREKGIPFVRGKGKHFVEGYCGPDIVVNF